MGDIAPRKEITQNATESMLNAMTNETIEDSFLPSLLRPRKDISGAAHKVQDLKPRSENISDLCMTVDNLLQELDKAVSAGDAASIAQLREKIKNTIVPGPYDGETYQNKVKEIRKEMEQEETIQSMDAQLKTIKTLISGTETLDTASSQLLQHSRQQLQTLNLRRSYQILDLLPQQQKLQSLQSQMREKHSLIDRRQEKITELEQSILNAQIELQPLKAKLSKSRLSMNEASSTSLKTK